LSAPRYSRFTPGKGPVSTVRYILLEIFDINMGFVSAQQVFNCITIIILLL